MQLLWTVRYCNIISNTFLNLPQYSISLWLEHLVNYMQMLGWINTVGSWMLHMRLCVFTTSGRCSWSMFLFSQLIIFLHVSVWNQSLRSRLHMLISAFSAALLTMCSCGSRMNPFNSQHSELCCSTCLLISIPHTRKAWNHVYMLGFFVVFNVNWA